MKAPMRLVLTIIILIFTAIAVCGCVHRESSVPADQNIRLITTTMADICEMYPNTVVRFINPQYYVTRSITEGGNIITCECRFFNNDFRVTSIEKATVPSDKDSGDGTISSVADIQVGSTTYEQIDSLYIYSSEYKYNKDFVYIYENGIRYCATLKAHGGSKIVDSICIVDNTAYLEAAANMNTSDLTIADFAFIRPVDTTYEEITALYPEFYTDSQSTHTRIIYALNDGSHLSLGFDNIDGRLCLAHIYWNENLDEAANLPYWNYEYPPIPNDVQDYCERIIIGTDTRSSVALSYRERKTMETSTGPRSIIIDNNHNRLGLYYAGYGDDHVICIDWLDSTLPHRDVEIDYNPYGAFIPPSE